MGDILDIKDIQRRRYIEDRYQATVKSWEGQLDIRIRLMRAEHLLRCGVAASQRDQELRDDGEQWPLWPGTA